MARIFITGSSDGLGLTAAQLLLEQGHAVVLHARNPQRAEVARAAAPRAEAVVTGDLSSIAATRGIADQVNELGQFNAVIHNAAIGYRERQRTLTADGLSHVFAVNTLAPYLLTALIRRPERLIYLSSELHRSGDASLKDLNWEHRTWNGQKAYSDTKLHDTLLAFAVARHWPEVYSNSVEPGWVPTKMGGPRASDDLDAGRRTQVWLATSEDSAARVTGRHFYHMEVRAPKPAANDVERQEQLLEACEGFSGVDLDALAANVGGQR